ncbi:adenylyltransferase/cytidyltransferase family protein [Acidobacteriota bacterium]
MDKLVDLKTLNLTIQGLRQEGKTIVLANGCFDLIHVGHIRYLKEAKELGDILVVALNSDSSVRRLKGEGRPHMEERERAALLSSLSCVDYLIIFSEGNVEHILRTLRPGYHAKGSDYTEDTVPERETVLEYGGKIAITGGPKVRSTSEVLKNIEKKTGPASRQ